MSIEALHLFVPRHYLSSRTPGFASRLIWQRLPSCKATAEPICVNKMTSTTRPRERLPGCFIPRPSDLQPRVQLRIQLRVYTGPSAPPGGSPTRQAFIPQYQTNPFLASHFRQPALMRCGILRHSQTGNLVTLGPLSPSSPQPY